MLWEKIEDSLPDCGQNRLKSPVATGCGDTVREIAGERFFTEVGFLPRCRRRKSVVGDRFEFRGIPSSGRDDKGGAFQKVVVDHQIQAESVCLLSEFSQQEIFTPSSWVNQLGLVSADDQGERGIRIREVGSPERGEMEGGI